MKIEYCFSASSNIYIDIKNNFNNIWVTIFFWGESEKNFRFVVLRYFQLVDLESLSWVFPGPESPFLILFFFFFYSKPSLIIRVKSQWVDSNNYFFLIFFLGVVAIFNCPLTALSWIKHPETREESFVALFTNCSYVNLNL